MSCDRTAGRGIDRKKTIEVQGCGFEAKGRRSREMIDPSIEANSSCYRSAKHRVLDVESVHAPPARGPQALDRRLKSRITGETKRSTAGCTVNVGTFSSAAFYSTGGSRLRERSEGLFVQKEKEKKEERKKRKEKKKG